PGPERDAAARPDSTVRHRSAAPARTNRGHRAERDESGRSHHPARRPAGSRLIASCRALRGVDRSAPRTTRAPGDTGSFRPTVLRPRAVSIFSTPHACRTPPRDLGRSLLAAHCRLSGRRVGCRWMTSRTRRGNGFVIARTSCACRAKGFVIARTSCACRATDFVIARTWWTEPALTSQLPFRVARCEQADEFRCRRTPRAPSPVL